MYDLFYKDFLIDDRDFLWEQIFKRIIFLVYFSTMVLEVGFDDLEWVKKFAKLICHSLW